MSDWCFAVRTKSRVFYFYATIRAIYQCIMSPFLLKQPIIPLLYALTISIFFLYFTLIAEVRERSIDDLLVDIYGVLGTVSAPMPPVIRTPSNVLYQSVYSNSDLSKFMQYWVLINIVFYSFNANTEGKIVSTGYNFGTYQNPEYSHILRITMYVMHSNERQRW